MSAGTAFAIGNLTDPPADLRQPRLLATLGSEELRRWHLEGGGHHVDGFLDRRSGGNEGP